MLDPVPWNIIMQTFWIQVTMSFVYVRYMIGDAHPLLFDQLTLAIATGSTPVNMVADGSVQ